jgi:hypothetical protein
MNLNISRVRSERALGIGCSALSTVRTFAGIGVISRHFSTSDFAGGATRLQRFRHTERRQRRRESWRYSSLSPTKSSLFASGDPGHDFPFFPAQQDLESVSSGVPHSLHHERCPCATGTTCSVRRAVPVL